MSPRSAAARTTADRAAAPRPAKVAPAAARPHLRVVPSEPLRRLSTRPAAAADRRKAPFVLLVVAMLVGTSLALLVLNILITLNSIKATDLRAQNAKEAQAVQALQQQAVDGGTSAALAAAATAAGLVPAGSAAYLVIGPDGSSSLRGSVTPAPEPVKPRAVPADKD
jgi:hypothetical protein